MTESKKMLTKEISAGDAAVEGVLAGLVAGVISAIFLILIGLVSGENPATILGRFDPASTGSPFIGGFLHLATSAVYGIVFAIFFRLISRRWTGAHRLAWLLGLIYGLLLFVVAEVIFLSGFESRLDEFSTLAFIVFHIIYGLTLGIVLERSNN